MMLQQLKQHRQTYEYFCANLLPLFAATPILIYQMGRGGSSSLRNSLMRCQAPQTTLIFHFHDFIPIRKMDPDALPIEEAYRPAMREEIQHARRVYAGFPRQQKVNWFFRENFYAASLYRNVIRRHRRAKIITLVREPIGTNISMYFQVLSRYTGFAYQESQFTTLQLIDIFRSKYNFTRPLTWFDVEMKPAIGIDVYQYPFSPQEGYSIIQAGNLELLILKAETPDSLKERVIAEFVGLDRFELLRSNVSDKKKYARQYLEFKNTIRFPASFVDGMYSSRFAKHFYSETELAALRTKWLDQGEDDAQAMR